MVTTFPQRRRSEGALLPSWSRVRPVTMGRSAHRHVHREDSAGPGFLQKADVSAGWDAPGPHLPPRPGRGSHRGDPSRAAQRPGSSTLQQPGPRVLLPGPMEETMVTSTQPTRPACPGPGGFPEPAPTWGPATRAVHAGHVRTGFQETSEALFLTQGFVYPEAA